MRSLFPGFLAAAGALRCLAVDDAPPLDITQTLQDLKKLRDQSVTTTKTNKQRLLQEVTAAASSGESAAGTWEKAIMATRFDGLTKEQTAFKAWRDGEGEVFKDAVVKQAARLYFNWLGLTLQRSMGTPVKDLLPAILNHVGALANDRAAMEKLEDDIKREEELKDGKHGSQGPKSNDRGVQKMHDEILQKSLAGSVYVEWLKIGDWLTVEAWEEAPGNYDGIFEKIILPELRVQRDARAVEYWDGRIKRETDKASRSKLEFAHDKFNSLRFPVLLWHRASEMAAVGLKNRAAGEMLAIVRKYPTHPSAGEWMSKIETLLKPPAPAATSSAAPAASSSATPVSAANPAAPVVAPPAVVPPK
ncbi:MAG: hypothetical protein K8R23_18705 [Chthoniobacter sp.]|nr:hypothetical protein [Chthoniobacter sp.]